MSKLKVYGTYLLGLALISAASSVSAQDIYPEDGWWWNPQEPGRGYLMERQDETMFVASFHYTDAGDPEWLIIVGSYVPEQSGAVIGTLSGEVSVVRDGQCIGCPYEAPMESVSVQDPALLTFHSNQTATLEWSFEDIELQRFFWAWKDGLEQLQGDWMLVTIPLQGGPSAMLASISGGPQGNVIMDKQGTELGFIHLDQGELRLSLDGFNESLPVLAPESKRFYAGSAGLNSDAVMGLRIDDLPLRIPDEISAVIDINDASAAFATPVSEIDRNFVLRRNPRQASQPTALTQTSYDAVMLNGVVLDLLSAGCYRPGDARADQNGNVPIGCNANSEWLLDPLGYNDRFGTDAHHAHTQPDGTYHYHGDPGAMFDAEDASGVSPVIGFAADGFPIYGSYFFDEETQTIRKAVSGWSLKTGARDSVSGPGGQYNGWYTDDYEFANSGDLDECNGMTVNGHYGYYVTDSYPWVLGCLSGAPDDSFGKN